MRLIRLAMALLAVSFSWVASANPALNNSVTGTVGTTAATQMVAGQANLSQVNLSQVNLGQVNLEGAALRDSRSPSRSSSTGGMNDSVPSGWLMVLVSVLLIGHQLRRKHRFLRPQRFNNL
jgi:hypothetical protein